ncbi:hypothetical protein FSZ31_00375 [Sphingorhabdus soli]|uniref:PAS domain-containing protein n=1 Tax=Flavisphingopyxis soli TaxID=2601267 RepID=A0A5C6UQW5_9SPHN|nr:hypothetical protein [Sphingorhabdus soli]TXC73258.1 hypothetical protein FSZ31_00375 [Sphingorhabdus soli]
MDTMRNFGSDFNGSDDYRDDGVDDAQGVEAPPQIGTDERRMHVRAYNFWAQMLGDRFYPPIEKLDVGNLSDFGPNAVLLDFTAGIPDPTVAFVGEALREECELPAELGHISDVPGRSLLSRLTDHYLQIIANRAPIGFEAEFVNERGVNIMYRGILLPFSSDNETIDFILGVMNWKEVADPALSASLRKEVETSIRHAQTPVAVAPVWADGPASEGLEDAAMGAEPAADAGLADWLSLARETAETAKDARVRSRSALYSAISRAYDFSIAAEERPDDYAELLDDAGLSVQARAPMTPIVKLVFGADYDKTRVTEYAAALAHAREAGLARGDLGDYLSRYDGGLKGLVRDIRGSRKNSDSADDRYAAACDALRAADSFGSADHAAGDAEFVVLIGRRCGDGTLAIVAAVDDDVALTRRAMIKAAAAR